jgi:hypothetical protein
VYPCTSIYARHTSPTSSPAPDPSSALFGRPEPLGVEIVVGCGRTSTAWIHRHEVRCVETYELSAEVAGGREEELVSISSMANVAIARRTDFGGPLVPNTVGEVASATADRLDTQSAGSSALKSIATYIPTEVIVLFLAALAAVRADRATEGTVRGAIASQSELITFWIFLVLTPVFVWLVYAGKVKTGGATIPYLPTEWPAWEMFAATVAFAAWAYAVPDSPFTRFEWYSVALGSFAVLVASTALGLLAPLIQRKISVPAEHAAP